MSAIYTFKTSIGTFEIRPDKVVGDGFELRVITRDDWERLGHYVTPQVAAGNVRAQATGCYEWDKLPTSAVPYQIDDITEWHRSPPS